MGIEGGGVNGAAKRLGELDGGASFEATGDDSEG
jgi:hypothetical protein